jgi:flavin-dependent dehydrogenase
LVDPLSGEGISTAVQSAGLAAQAIEAYLTERAGDLSSYQTMVDGVMMPELTYTGFLGMLGPLRLLVDAWGTVARKSRYPHGEANPLRGLKPGIKEKTSTAP